MSLYTIMFNFDEDFTTFQEHITNILLQSGLLLDEHEYQISMHFENNKLIRQLSRNKRNPGNQIFNFIHHILSNVILKNVSKYLENCYKQLIDDLIQCCRNQSTFNLGVKRHFERRLSGIRVLDIASSLKESTLLEHEIEFLNDTSLLLTQTNKLMMTTKESVINCKMKELGFQLFETNYTKGCDLAECLDLFKETVDVFIYNSSEFLTAVVLSFLQLFKLDDSEAFHNLHVIIPNFLKSFKSSLEESEKKFENTKYLLAVKDEFSISELIKKEVPLKPEDFIIYNISEILRNLQLSFEIVTTFYKSYQKNCEISAKDVENVKICLKKSLENISYIDKLIQIKSIKTNVENKLQRSDNLTPDSKKIIVIDNAAENPVDEVFSCYISNDTEVCLTKQYDDLFQNYTSQKMLITELQEKLDLLTNLKGRKIAPEPGDQFVPIKEEPLKVTKILENPKETVPRPPPIPPKLPVFNVVLSENNSNYNMTKSLATQVKEIANKNKRDEEIFGSEHGFSDNDD